MDYWVVFDPGVEGVKKLLQDDIGDGDAGLDVVDYFDENYEAIKTKLEDISLRTIKDALQILNEYGVSCIFDHRDGRSLDGKETANKYIELIIQKEEMMKKIIRDNNTRATVNQVVKANNLLPKYVNRDITKFLLRGGEVNGRTTIIRRKRRKTNNISNKKRKIKRKIKRKMSKKKPQKKINTKKKNNRRKTMKKRKTRTLH